jgi:hypothetical protein
VRACEGVLLDQDRRLPKRLELVIASLRTQPSFPA